MSGANDHDDKKGKEKKMMMTKGYGKLPASCAYMCGSMGVKAKRRFACVCVCWDFAKRATAPAKRLSLCLATQSKIVCPLHYYLVQMDEQSIRYTAFTTSLGHFKFIRMPFELRNAPAEFCEIMQGVLGDLPF